MKKMGLKLLLVLWLPSLVGAANQKIAVIGTGYVGLVVGTCLADFGHNVTCADINTTKIAMLNRGEMPIYEPGLDEMVHRLTEQGLLAFSDEPAAAIRAANIIYIAVDTPMSEDGRANLSAVRAVAKTIGENLNGHKLICTKSTVPIGTGAEIANIIRNFSGQEATFDVVSNPEFLKEGSAIHDFLHPERIVIGSQTAQAAEVMKEVYAPLIERGIPVVITDLETSETIKYACNAFLAVKISFINEIANLCDATGADVLGVAKGMGYDSRIGHKFLMPGPGFGGSCFPKDVQALLYKGRTTDVDLNVVSAAVRANEGQKERVFQKFTRLMNYDVCGKKIALLGLSFKANTDDVRYSPAITFIERALEAGALVRAYDPIAMNAMKLVFPGIEYGTSLYDAVKGADAVVVLTEWNEFKDMNLPYIKSLLKSPVILDARNILKVADLDELGFVYDNMGNARVV